MTNEQKLIKEVIVSLRDFGFEYNKNESTALEEIKVSTKMGILNISRITGERKFYSIFMKFDNPSLASSYVDCNVYTGKWNIHQNTLDRAIKEFRFRLIKLQNI